MMGKIYLRMNQEIPVYFMINPDLVGNGQGLRYGKRNTFYYLGVCGVVFNNGIGRVCLLFSHFSFSVFHQTGKHL